jgi:hypothetical protein
MVHVHADESLRLSFVLTAAKMPVVGRTKMRCDRNSSRIDLFRSNESNILKQVAYSFHPIVSLGLGFQRPSGLATST